MLTTSSLQKYDRPMLMPFKRHDCHIDCTFSVRTCSVLPKNTGGDAFACNFTVLEDSRSKAVKDEQGGIFLSGTVTEQHPPSLDSCAASVHTLAVFIPHQNTDFA